MLAPNTATIRLKRNQMSVFLDGRRFIVLVAGRRFGKTYLSVALLMREAVTKPGSRSWYIAPTYRQAKMIAWKILKEHIPKEARESTNEQELTIILKNGSEISLKGADNPDSLRGAGLDLAILDEYADMSPSVWGEVVRPMLATTNGRALFIGTPKGYDHFYDLFMAAQATQKYWGAYHFTTIEGGYVPVEEVLAAKMDPTISEREFRQEWEASFENLTGKVYDNFDRRIGEGNVATIEYHGGAILAGLDFNVDPMTASFAQKAGRRIEFFDELSIRNSNTHEMIEAVKAKFQKDWRKIIWYPDPAGNSRSTKAPVGTTDYTLLRRAGFQVYDPRRPYPIIDRINTVNAMLKNAAGQRYIFFDALNCKETIKAFDGLCYKEGTKLPDKKSGLDHYADNVGYLVMGVAPLRRRNTTATQEFRV